MHDRPPHKATEWVGIDACAFGCVWEAVCEREKTMAKNKALEMRNV